MNRKQNFIAIFAIALMALGTSLLFSCNADEEEYDFNGVYTMANGMKTRSGEQNYSGTSDDNLSKILHPGEDTLLLNLNSIKLKLKFNLSWTSNFSMDARATVTLDKCYNSGPIYTYYDEFNILRERREYEFVRCQFETPIKIHNDKITVDVVKVWYTNSIKMIDENNQPIYIPGTEEQYVTDVLEYTISDSYFEEL